MSNDFGWRRIELDLRCHPEPAKINDCYSAASLGCDKCHARVTERSGFAAAQRAAGDGSKKESAIDHVRPSYLVWSRLLFSIVLPLGANSAVVSFSPPLQAWKEAIETAGQRRIITARIFTDADRNELLLPADAEQRPVIAALLRSSKLREQLVNAYALTVNLDRGAARWSFILMNMARAADWGDEEDALLAHELGHVWLHARDYPSPPFQGCAAVHIGDIVQHVLIREETARRRIALQPYMVRTFEVAHRAMKAGSSIPGDPDGCRLWAALSLLADVRSSEWEGKAEFEQLLEQRFPGLAHIADGLEGILAVERLRSRDGYVKAIESVASALSRYPHKRAAPP